jgi:hypothetical protein
MTYEGGTKCSETSAYKIQKPGNYPEENIEEAETCRPLLPCIYNTGVKNELRQK